MNSKEKAFAKAIEEQSQESCKQAFNMMNRQMLCNHSQGFHEETRPVWSNLFKEGAGYPPDDIITEHVCNSCGTTKGL